MSVMNSTKEGAAASEQLPTHKTSNLDVEGQGHQRKAEDEDEQVSAFKSLGWLDRFLALWIILAMAIGIILGNFVPSTGPALEKGKFVGVSVPIGMRIIGSVLEGYETDDLSSHRPPRHDVPYSLQSPIRVTTPAPRPACHVEADRIQYPHQLDRCPIFDGIFILRSLSQAYNRKSLTSNQLGLAWAFLPDKSELRIGLILVGLGRCIAMVGVYP